MSWGVAALWMFVAPPHRDEALDDETVEDGRSVTKMVVAEAADTNGTTTVLLLLASTLDGFMETAYSRLP